jgi:hypothetical protein
MNFIKLTSGNSWEVTDEMYPVFEDLIEQQRENLLKLLVCLHESVNSMKLTIMWNCEVEAVFLKITNGGRWGIIQKCRVNSWNWRAGLTSTGKLDSMKLNHKMKLWTNMKFSPYQNHEWWGVFLWHMYWDLWFETLARYSTYSSGCFFYQSFIIFLFSILSLSP